MTDAGAAAAFFDVDKTLIRGSSMFHMACGFAMRGFFTPAQVGGFVVKQLRFAAGGEDLRDISVILEQAQMMAKGRDVTDLVAVGEEIFAERIIDKVRPEVLDLARDHLAAGRGVWLVSATGQEIADMFARRLGLTGALGTRSETSGGVYTGRMAGPAMHGPQKAVAITELAESQGLDLRQCFAYADSANDIAMLSVVGNPVAVNPDKRLRQHALEHGWPIRRYR
ncbi:MAG: HAD-IB family hydrolase [Candidatus Nanopelagicales bacterium]|nr:HAD-IB family hydrolase [Candidatus Nanopelagicales bacterium]MDZ4249959.1 HAD-IB family hydrolase [Candidatus Nanopelagicales bacterium]MDZ7578594.1 HAD-IB family hydrolase [Candidatus Nanopelagicales bacterium]